LQSKQNSLYEFRLFFFLVVFRNNTEVSETTESKEEKNEKNQLIVSNNKGQLINLS